MTVNLAIGTGNVRHALAQLTVGPQCELTAVVAAALGHHDDAAASHDHGEGLYAVH